MQNIINFASVSYIMRHQIVNSL